MTKTIEIILTSTGQTRVETNGFIGSECRQASRFIEQALGQQTNELLKAEFHESESRVCQHQRSPR